MLEYKVILRVGVLCNRLLEVLRGASVGGVKQSGLELEPNTRVLVVCRCFGVRVLYYSAGR